jgi:hypothetical protein
VAPVDTWLPTVDITSPHRVFAGQPLWMVPDDGNSGAASACWTPIPRKGPALTNPTARGLWLAVTVLTAALVGITAGLLAWAGGLNPPTAILTGGAAFGSTVLLVLAVLHFAGSSTQ